MIRLAFALQLEQGGFTLDVADEAAVEVLGLFGPSGSGKTSLLEAIAGLRRPRIGRVTVGDDVLLDTARAVDVPPHHRSVGYLPQDGALFPHLDVRRNVSYGADSRRGGSASGRAAIDLRQIVEMLDIVQLMTRPVRELSGGERQRVALARALASAPRMLLLDEPLAAVDRGRKDQILPYLLRIRRELHVPMVYVTHDAGEMAAIADRVLLLEQGRLVRGGAPSEVLPAQ